MAIFVIFRVADPIRMGLAVQREFPNDHLKVKPDEWLVSAIGTAKDVSDRLQVTPENVSGAAMIFSMANYYGRAATEIWDWIKTKAEQTGG